VYLVTSGLLWGTGGLIGSLLGREAGLPPLSVAAYRLTVGGALIVVFLTVAGRRWPAGRAAWTRIAVVGLLAACFQSCYFTAVSLTSVSLATLVTIGSAPVLVQVAGWVRGRRSSRGAGERGAGGLATTGLALTGLGLLVGLPSGRFAETAVLASSGMAVLAASGFAAMTLIGSKPVPGLDDLAVTGFGFTLGGGVLMAVAALVGGLGFAPRPGTIGLLIALGIGPTAVAYTSYFRGLRTSAASTAALLSLLEPLTGTILAVLLLGNRLSPAGIAGAVILGVAVILTVHPRAGSGQHAPYFRTYRAPGPGRPKILDQRGRVRGPFDPPSSASGDCLPGMPRLRRPGQASDAAPKPDDSPGRS
jgi:DME family drug/metabolite transporter